MADLFASILAAVVTVAVLGGGAGLVLWLARDLARLCLPAALRRSAASLCRKLAVPCLGLACGLWLIALRHGSGTGHKLDNADRIGFVIEVFTYLGLIFVTGWGLSLGVVGLLRLCRSRFVRKFAVPCLWMLGLGCGLWLIALRHGSGTGHKLDDADRIGFVIEDFIYLGYIFVIGWSLSLGVVGLLRLCGSRFVRRCVLYVYRTVGGPVGWGSSILVSLWLLAIGLSVIWLHYYGVSDRERRYAGPAPWFTILEKEGTGFFVDPGGTIVTASGNVDECRKITIAGKGLRAVPARVLAKGSGPVAGAAVLKADAPAPAYLSFADVAMPTKTLTGLPTIAIGYDYFTGFSQITRSIRPAMTIPDLIYFAVMPDYTPYIAVLGRLRSGNEGSPLLTSDGHVIGMLSHSDLGFSYGTDSSLYTFNGFGIIGGYLVDWLSHLRIQASMASPEVYQSRSEIESALVKIYCLKKNIIN